jgi:putative peptidoglycan lipid II flippase
VSDAAARPAHSHKVANAAALVTVLSVLSPAAGLFLEVSLAWKFGASGPVDAFRTAYLLIGFGSQLFMGLLLPHIVVPLVAGYRARGQEEAGWRLAISFGQILTLAGLLFAAWVFLYPAPLSHLLAPGLHGVSLAQSLSLMRFFALAFAAVLWCGVVTGILYVHHVFALPLLSQLICSLSIASGVLLYGNRGTLGIASGACFGFGVMLVLHLNALVRIARRTGIPLLAVFRPAPRRDVAAVLIRSVPLLALAFSGMVSTAILNNAVSRFPAGSLALYGYASKLVTVVLFASASLATVMFPIFSDASARGDWGQFSRSGTRGIRMVLLLTVPLAAVTYMLREPLVRAAFDRGALSPGDVALVTHLFAILLYHAPASALGFLLLKIYFARGDTRAPAALHLLFPLALYLTIPGAIALYGGPGILIAFDVVAWLVPLSLLVYGIARYRIAEWRPLGRFCVTLAIFSTALALVAAGVDRFFRFLGPRHFLLNITDLAVASGAALLAALLLSRKLAIAEAHEIEGFLAWRFRG